MKRALIPVIAGVTIVTAAVAQQTTPKLDTRPEKADVRVHRIEMFCAPSSFLGVYPADVTDDKGKELGMTETYGALLNDVVENSPAVTAGLQKNDVVISWNGTRVESAAALRRMVLETPVGRSVRIGYIRAGVRNEIDAKIGTRPAPTEGMMMPEVPFPPDAPTPPMMGRMPMMDRMIFMSTGDPRTGMTLQTMTPQLAKYFGGDAGVLLGAVAEKSSAAEAGLQAGDVVVSIDGKKVSSPMEANQIIMKKEGSVEVKVIRDKKEQTFTVKLNGKPMDLNLPDMRIFEEQLRGPNVQFRSFRNGEENEEQEIVIPDEESADPDLSDLKIERQGNVERRIRVVPAPAHEVRREAPPAGL